MNLTFCALLLLMSGTPTPAAPSKFEGIWLGTYNSQPTALLPDGTYPENVHQFELHLQERGRSIRGYLRGLGPVSGPVLPIKNGRRFGDRACFDVITENGDMRWCVSARGDRLEGAWSSGPQGGSSLRGAGAGARLFAISGTRSKSK